VIKRTTQIPVKCVERFTRAVVVHRTLAYFFSFEELK
jgi:hypothetical protein